MLSSSHGNSSELVSVCPSLPLLLSWLPLPPTPALSSCLIALWAPMPRFGTKVQDLALRFSIFWPQMNSPVLSHLPLFKPFALCTIFYSPAPWYILYSPTPILVFSPTWNAFSYPNMVVFWDQSKATHFYDVSFNSKYLLIIFVQGTILGIWERRINRRGTVPALTKLLKKRTSHR